MKWKGLLPLQPNRRLWEIKTSVRNATPGGDGRGGEGEGEGDAEGGRSVLCEGQGSEEGGRKVERK